MEAERGRSSKASVAKTTWSVRKARDKLQAIVRIRENMRTAAVGKPTHEGRQAQRQQLGIEVTHKEPLIVDGFGGTHVTHCTSARVKLKMKRTDGRFFTMFANSVPRLGELEKFWSLELVGVRDPPLQTDNEHAMKRFSESEIVIVAEEDLPRAEWKLGKVEKLYKNHEGKTKTVDVKMPNGHVLKRPVSMLYPLEVSEEEREALPTTKSKELVKHPADQNLQAEETEEEEETRTKPETHRTSASTPQTDGYRRRKYRNLLKVFPCKKLEVSQVSRITSSRQVLRDLPVRIQGQDLIRASELGAQLQQISLSGVSDMRGTMLLCTVSTPGTKPEPSLAPRTSLNGITQLRADMEPPTNVRRGGSVAKREMRHRGSLQSKCSKKGLTVSARL
uniref:DUF5641 domain-containing protein n=1 Tax=Parascaris univalens TaxID=6257 RepID=A0A915B208_PARUN